MKTTDYDMCEMCAEIVTQGYTDLIDDTQEHQRLCNHIDKKVLPQGEYWLDSAQVHYEAEYGKTCEGCGVRGTTHVVQSCKN